MSSQNKFRTMRGRRQVNDVTIETYTSLDITSNSVSILQAETSKKDKSKKNSEEDVKNTLIVEKDEKTKSNVVDLRLEPITFMSGNPFVEVTKGILHLYKEE